MTDDKSGTASAIHDTTLADECTNRRSAPYAREYSGAAERTNKNTGMLSTLKEDFQFGGLVNLIGTLQKIGGPAVQASIKICGEELARRLNAPRMPVDDYLFVTPENGYEEP